MRAALYACVAILVTQPVAAKMEKVAPEGPIWDTSPGFHFPDADKPKKMRRALSGISCPYKLNGPRRCIAVFDEGGEARYVLVDGTRFVPQPEPIVLLSKGELDAEGAASDGGFVYVTGSHSRKRKECAANPESRHVYRLPVRPDGSLEPSSQPVDDKGRLWGLMSTDTVLGPFVDKCLGEEGHGINIEGLAARNGQLYFGFREPATKRTAYILRVASRALFEGGDLTPRLLTIEVGEASGIRDLLAVPEGLLVLVGPDDDSKENVPWWIGFWDGKDDGGKIDLRPLAELKLPKVDGHACHEEIKPEAMTLLTDGPDFRRILILSDGLCDGGPLSYRIPK